MSTASDTGPPRTSRTSPAADHERADGLQARAVGELLLRAADQLARGVAEATAAEGLTGLEGRTLRDIREALPQRRLAERLGVDPARVTTSVQRLAALGLVHRSVGDDRRQRLVRLTPRGVEVVDRIGARLYATSPLVNRLDDDQRSVLADLLGRIVGVDAP